MYRKQKAEGMNFGSKTNEHLARHQTSFSNKQYRAYWRISQCKNCGSDFMRWAVDGYCQDCQQNVEFIVRERSYAMKTATTGGGKNDDPRRRG
jgi:predicted Zn-ribbon and HTH transcriptional regulator